MMVRLLAFILNADDLLEFGAGLSTDDEPDLWRKSLDGQVMHWIEVGMPDPKRIRQAHGRSRKVSVLGYGGGRFQAWHQNHREELASLQKLELMELMPDESAALAALSSRSMTFTASIQDGRCWLTTGTGDTQLELHPVVHG